MLDTNVVSEVIRNPAGRVAQHLRTVADQVCISVVVAAELRYGCAKKGSARLSERIEDLLAEVPVVSLEQPADRAYGDIGATLERSGMPIGMNDLLIAAHALALDAVVVTANDAEFRRVHGLLVENWSDATA